MKKFISVMAFSFFYGHISLSAGSSDLQQIETKLPAPFETLVLSNVWDRYDENDDHVVSFEHKDNGEVEFELFVSNSLSESITLEKIYRELQEYADGMTNDLPILRNIIELDFENENDLEDDNESDEDDSDEDKWEDFDEEEFNIIESVEYVSMSGIDWIKTISTSVTKIEFKHYVYDGDELSIFNETTLNIPTRHIDYLTILDNRLNIVSFSAPAENFSDVKTLFQDIIELNLGK